MTKMQKTTENDAKKGRKYAKRKYVILTPLLLAGIYLANHSI